MGKKVILKINNLTKFFKSKNNYKIALDNISFNVSEGDFLGIIGESGSGKTTLGKTIIRLENASSGKIFLYDKIISNKKINKNINNFICKNMQMIFQDPLSSLNPKMTILKLISEPIVINKSTKIKASQIIKDRINLNFLFEYDILIDLKNNKYYTLLEFYEKYNLLIDKTLNKLKNFNFSNKDSWTNSFAELEVVYDYFINNERKITSLLSKMLDESKKIVKKYNNKILKNEIDSDFKEYIKINKAINDLERNFLENNSSIKFKKELKRIESEINLIKDPEIIHNEINDLKIHIKSNINNYKSSKNLKNYNYYYFLSLIDKYRVKILNSFLNFSNVEKKDLLNKYFLLSEKIDEFSKKKYTEIFSNSKKENVDNINNEYFLNMVNELDGILAADIIEFQKEFEIIDERNKIIINNFNLEKNKILEELKKFKFNNINLKKDLYKSQDYVNLNIQLNKVKKKIIEFQKTKKNNYLNFKKNDLLNIKNDLKLKINLVKKNKKILKSEFKKLNLFLLKIRPSNLEKFSILEKFALIKTNTKSMKDQLKIKLSSLNLIDFELKKILDYYFIEEKICSSNKYKLIFYKSEISKLLIVNKVFNLLESVGLKKEHAYRYPHEFSGGQRQRIVIARALINDPKIIIADEAISALDVSVQAQVINMMKDLSKERNVTFLFIAHDLSMVRYICNKVLIMHNGKILEKGLVNKIFNNPIHPYTKSLLKAVPELSKMDIDLSVFEDTSNYDKEYSIINYPKFIKVDNDHEVLATEDQFKKWIK